MCSDSLLAWQGCIVGQTKGKVAVGAIESDQEKLNDEVEKTITALGLFKMFYLIQ